MKTIEQVLENLEEARADYHRRYMEAPEGSLHMWKMVARAAECIRVMHFIQEIEEDDGE